MRIVIANDGFSDVGGVQVYLDHVIESLTARGHELAIAYCNDRGGDSVGRSLRLTRFHVAGADGRSSLEVVNDRLDAVRAWAPEICFSHNMRDAAVDAGLASIAPVVKFMHGYVGTCISGLKMHAFPEKAACDHVFGPACLGWYFPRRCGQVDLHVMTAGWREARAANALFNRYAAIIVASDHMKREYLRHACDPDRVHVNPLFPTTRRAYAATRAAQESNVAFLGRMTALKGGDLLIRAVKHASRQIGPIRLAMIGDGPQRAEWEALARSLNVPSAFPGWLGDERWPLLARASIVAVPSIWPEPFGLVGLEAASLGIPAIAHDVGGIREWLRDGRNGVLVPAPASPEAFGDALAGVLGNRDRLAALGRGALQTAREMTLDAHVDNLERIFLSTVQASAPAVGHALSRVV